MFISLYIVVINVWIFCSSNILENIKFYLTDSIGNSVFFMLKDFHSLFFKVIFVHFTLCDFLVLKAFFEMKRSRTQASKENNV